MTAGRAGRFERMRGRSRAAPLAKTAGTHRFLWNMAGSSTGRGRARMVAPGTYSARLTAHDSSQVVSFEVTLDPRLAAEGITAADLQEQAAFLARVSEVQARARELQKKVRDWRGQLEGLIEADGADAAAARHTDEQLVVVQDRLTNQPGGRYVQPMLVSQLSYLSSNAGRADQAPGNHAYMRLEALEKELKGCEAAFAKIDGPKGKPPRRAASRRGK